MTAQVALKVSNLSKSFKAVKALDEVTMSLRYGSVTALLGDNGAGKSTLVKCLAGVYQPDAGSIAIDGKVRSIPNPDKARELGIETVHQNLAVINTLDVADNLFLGREQTKGGPVGRWLGWLDKAAMRQQCSEVLRRLEIELPSLRSWVGSLSGGQRQAVSIGRALAWGQRIVLLDEPAAALGVQQTAKVLDLIRGLRDQGVAVLLITHNMDRVTQVCDDAVVLCHGRKVADISVEDVTIDDLVGYITGSKTALNDNSEVAASGDQSLPVG